MSRLLGAHEIGDELMQTVYLGGPIAGLGYAAATDWRDTAVVSLAAAGITGVSPLRAKEYLKHITDDIGFSATCTEYGHLSPLSSARGIMARDRFDATRCDVMLVNLLGAQKPSLGTVIEIGWADLKRIPVVAVIEADGSNVHEHAMVAEAIDFRCVSLDEALHVVKAILL